MTADHSEVVWPADCQVSLHGTAHHQEDGAAHRDPGGNNTRKE